MEEFSLKFPLGNPNPTMVLGCFCLAPPVGPRVPSKPRKSLGNIA